MSDRFPLILDSTDNRIKEIPTGDNLDLQGCSVINANSISAGTISVDSITVNSNSLGAVALSNDYRDLDNTPTGFSKDYYDLNNLPTIPNTTRELNDVEDLEPNTNQALIYNGAKYEPGNVVTEIDLSQFTIGELGNVSTVGTITNKFLKYTAGAWRPSRVQYAELQDKPTNVSFFANDAGYITASDIQEIQGDFQGSVLANDSTILVDGVAGKIVGNVDTSIIENTSGNLIINASNYVVIDSTDNGQIEIGRASGVGDVIIGNSANGTDINLEGNVTFASGTTTSGISYTNLTDTPTSITDFGITDGTSGQVLTTDGEGNFTFEDPGDQIGNFTLSSSIIDTDDSSAITITPALVINSDLTVENDVTVDGTVTASSFVATGEGNPEFSSETDITLNAAERVTIISSPLKFASFSTAERDNLSSENGDVIYNLTVNRFQGYQNGAWINIDDINTSVSGNIVPDTADTYDLGSSDKPFRSLYLSDNTLIVGGYSLGIDNGNLKLTPPGENPGAEGFEVDEVVSNALVVLDNFGLDRFATMNLGSTIEFEQRTEQSGIEIGKLGSFDNFIGFTEFGGMMISTSGVPATSIGQPGTPVGAIAFDSDYIYYCVAPYDGATDIWRRTPWAESSW